MTAENGGHRYEKNHVTVTLCIQGSGIRLQTQRVSRSKPSCPNSSSIRPAVSTELRIVIDTDMHTPDDG